MSDIDWLFPDNPEIREIVKREQGKPAEEVDPVVGPLQKNLQVPFGTYTVVVPGDVKPHRTIEIEPWNGRFGVHVFKMLVGPDNELDFQGFGQTDATGKFKVWRSFAERQHWINAAQVLVDIYNNTEGGLDMAGELYALKSSRCRKCHHKLTVPASLHRGYGPDCWGNL